MKYNFEADTVRINLAEFQIKQLQEKQIPQTNKFSTDLIYQNRKRPRRMNFIKIETNSIKIEIFNVPEEARL